MDNVTGTAGNDTVKGFVSLSTSGTSTLTAGDQIEGGAGTDTLEILIDTTTSTNTMTPLMNGVETVVVRNLSDAAGVDTLSLVQATGVKSVMLNNSLSGGDLSVTNAPISGLYGVTNTPAETTAAAGITVTVSAVDVIGTADTVAFSVKNAGSKVGNAPSNAAVLNVGNLSGVESVSVATSGTNYIAINGSDTTDTKSVVITGDGNNEISLDGGLNSTLTIDASASTGANTFKLGTNLTSSDVVKGGTGADVLSIEMTDATGVSVTGVEVLRIENTSVTSPATSNTITFAADPKFTKIEVRESTDSIVLAGISAGTTLAFVGADASTSSTTYGLGRATNDTLFGKVTFNTAFAGTADVLKIELGNQGVNSSSDYEASVTASGIETINIVQSDINSSATSTVRLVDNGLKTLTVSSNSNASVTFDGKASSIPGSTATTSETHSNSLTLVDFSAVVGTSTFTGSLAGAFAAASELKTAQGGMTYTFGKESATDSITVTGNKGVDNITTGSVGSFVANLGEGNDRFSAASIATSADGTVKVDGGAGDDTLIGGAGADTLTGGEGADSITGGKGADSLNGGAGADTYVQNLGAAIVPGEQQVTTLYVQGLENGETFRVTAGGQTFSKVFTASAYDSTVAGLASGEKAAGRVMAFLQSFVSDFGDAIRAATGGPSGLTVTADSLIIATTATIPTTSSASLKFVGNTVSSTSADGITTTTGYTFTNPTASIVDSLGNSAGIVTTNARQTVSVTAPSTGFATAGDKFTIGIGQFGTDSKLSSGSTATVTFVTDLATSLKQFALANPTVGGSTVEYVLAGGTTPTLVITTSSTATGATSPADPLPSVATTAAWSAGSTAETTYGTALTASAVAGIDAPAAGKAEVAATVSDSSYTVSSLGVISNTIDQIQWADGDKVDIGTTAIKFTAVTGSSSVATIGSTGIATFASVPATLKAALDLVAAGIHASGTTASPSVAVTEAGEAAVFEFGGKNYLFISDNVQGLGARDLVMEIVGLSGPLTTGLSINDGNIIAIG